MDSNVQRTFERADPPAAEGAALAEALRQVAPDGALAVATSDAEIFRFDPTPADPGERGALQVERVEMPALVGYQTAWADLCGRALESNVFLEPAFALPLVQHVNSPRRPAFLFVWEDNGVTSFGRLLGLIPLELHQGRRHLDGILRVFAHEQTSCGMPLVDRERADDVFAALMDWIGTNERRIAAIEIAGIARHGPFHAALDSFCERTGRRLVGIGEHQRAILRPPGPGIAVCHVTSTKRRKERARQNRRLSETGRRAYTSARTPSEVALAAERFLALEHNGWKGARGTALLSRPTLATFTRTMTRLMAHEGKCRIDAIEIDGRPVAMGILLSLRNRAYYWKTAFDETYRSLSPGVQFTMELTRGQLADRHVAFTDSCAVANHPMIDRLWPERMAVTDLMVATAPGTSRRFARCLALERLERTLRRHAKALWHLIRRFAA